MPALYNTCPTKVIKKLIIPNSVKSLNCLKNIPKIPINAKRNPITPKSLTSNHSFN